jgi:hypothetical protein
MAGSIGCVIGLKDPPPGKNRWSQAIEWFWSFSALSVIFNTVLLGWLLGTPLWSRWACFVACFVAALFIDVFSVNWRRKGPWDPQLAQGTTTNSDGAAVSFHSIDRSTDR